MKTMIGLGIVASVALLGCATEPETELGVAARSVFCPDESCGTTNGAGIYTDEYGKASIIPGGDSMITRMFPNPSGMWTMLRVKTSTGYDTPQYESSRAFINGVEYTLTGITEDYTVPTFHFSNHADVTGDAITSVRIFIHTGDTNLGATRVQLGYTLSFWKGSDPANQKEAIWGNVAQNKYEYFYYVRVNPGLGYDSGNWSPYCLMADGTTPDPIVFQDSIDVNAGDGSTDRSSGTMTFSCRHGAIAKARLWGYIYGNNASQLAMFESAIHMKRASYCGNGGFHTVSGTDIVFKDTAGIETMNVSCSKLEAVWGIDAGGINRAICYNYANRRIHGNDFGGNCPDGVTIPPCPCNANGVFAGIPNTTPLIFEQPLALP